MVQIVTLIHSFGWKKEKNHLRSRLSFIKYLLNSYKYLATCSPRLRRIQMKRMVVKMEKEWLKNCLTWIPSESMVILRWIHSLVLFSLRHRWKILQPMTCHIWANGKRQASHPHQMRAKSRAVNTLRADSPSPLFWNARFIIYGLQLIFKFYHHNILSSQVVFNLINPNALFV